MRSRLLLAAAAMTGLIGFAPLPVDPKKPAPSLLGVWEVVSIEGVAGRDTKKDPKEFVRIEKGKWSFEREGKPYQSFTMTTDEKARKLDLAEPGKPPFLGIYKIEGDQLLWSYQSNGKRPSGFKPMSREHTTLKLRRVKESKKEMPK